LRGIGIEFNFFTIRVAKWLIPLIVGVVIISFIPFYFYLPIAFIMTMILTIKMKYFSQEEIKLLQKAINYDSWKNKIRKQN
jgi:hypothetical protein